MIIPPPMKVKPSLICVNQASDVKEVRYLQYKTMFAKRLEIRFW